MARQRHLVQLLVAQHPEFVSELNASQLEADRKKGRRQGRLTEARIILRRVLARRGFELGEDEETRIDACITIATLEHWIDEAVVASSAAEAMGPPHRA